jgi:hypothetical protein
MASALSKLPRVFTIELACYSILLGLWVWLVGIIAQIIDGSNQLLSNRALEAAEAELLRSFMGLSIAVYCLLFGIIALIVWVLSRYFVWRAITQKRLDSHHIMENLLLGVPFNVLKLGAMACVLYVGYLILRPFLAFQSFVLVVVAGELIMLLFCAPLLFQITGFASVAYYWYFMHDDPRFLGFFTMPFRKLFRMGKYKYRHAYPNLRSWEKTVLLLAGVFVVLDIVLIFVHLLPPPLNWGLMLLLYVLFVSWSKLYMIDRVFV